MTSICKNALALYQLTTYYLCVLLPEGFKNFFNGYDFNACNNVREILYNTDITTFVVKLIVHNPVGKLV